MINVRREKISERMKYLQDLVPGCNKITDKAGMLNEIINYVQSLQRQVEEPKEKKKKQVLSTGCQAQAKKPNSKHDPFQKRSDHDQI
uniref:BHLH domain-containing protein n=1 Tax=Gossypium raimondii TaxID=29730 RepID=A0A0D2PFY3_GOSRA|nr:hypothetical protein B456_004G212900 [Gossypium raimondii]